MNADRGEVTLAELGLLLHRATRPPGATPDELARLEAEVGRLPASYLELLRHSNGAAGRMGDNEIVFYGIEDLLEDLHPLAPELPDYLVFGGDGAEATFGFLPPYERSGVYAIHTDDIDPRHLVEMAPSFAEFVRLLLERNWIDVWCDLDAELLDKLTRGWR